jgi:hypothetical protein
MTNSRTYGGCRDRSLIDDRKTKLGHRFDPRVTREGTPGGQCRRTAPLSAPRPQRVAAARRAIARRRSGESHAGEGR